MILVPLVAANFQSISLFLDVIVPTLQVHDHSILYFPENCIIGEVLALPVVDNFQLLLLFGIGTKIE